MMTLKNALVSAVLAGILAIGLASSMGFESLRGATASSGTPIGGTGFEDLGGTVSDISNASNYSIALVGQAEASAAASLSGRSLAYFAGTDVNTQWSMGVSYSQASANGWLLKDSSGNLLVNQGYGYYVGDVGSSGYQQAWITNVLAFLGAHPGLDGVEIDDVLYDLVPMTGVEASKYPSQQAWASAQLSFVAAVGDALRSHGYYVLVNASGYIPNDTTSNDGTNTVSWWQQLGPHVSGLMNEYYAEISTGSNTLRAAGADWTQEWDGWQRLIGTAQAMGRDFVGLTYGYPGDTRTMLYGRASFLMEWNGGGSAFIFNPGDNSDPANAALTTDVGQPAAAKEQVGVGWTRKYTGGMAIVNPSPSSSQTFQLGGTYQTLSGSSVTSVTLAPTTGMILTGSNAAAPAAAPSTTTATTTTATTTTTAPPPTTTTTSTPPPTTTTTITTTATTSKTSSATGKTTTATTTTTPTTTTTASGSGSGSSGSPTTTTSTTTTPTVTTPVTVTSTTSSPTSSSTRTNGSKKKKKSVQTTTTTTTTASSWVAASRHYNRRHL